MSKEKIVDHQEKGLEVPYSQLNPETLQRMIQEFVTRDGTDWLEAGGSLEAKVEQVIQQLKKKKIKIVFDLTSQTANFVVCK